MAPAPDTTAKPEPTRTIAGRVVKAIKSEARGMVEGRVYVEVYLPFDVQAFAAFVSKARALGDGAAGYQLAAAADPDLASKALTPIDAQGEAMLPADLEVLADSFLIESRRIDVGHDQEVRKGVHVVGSFLNTPEIASPHYWPGAWVVVLKVDPGSPEFTAIEAGTLNAVSFQAVVVKVPITVSLSPTPQG